MEGLLFGVRASDSVTSTTDAGTATSVSTSTVLLRYLITGSRQSFYDSRGVVDVERLAAFTSTMEGMVRNRVITEDWVVV